MRRHIDSLGPDVHTIEVSQDGELVNVSSKSEDDETRYICYPLLQDLQKPKIHEPRIRTVLRAELRELDRLGPNVDLVSYRGRKLVFKYCFWSHQTQLLWDEINILTLLPLHPNIIPLHWVVVEKLHAQEHIVGFTTRYIAGGNLAAEGRRVFKLKWLKQLISVIDDLNHKYGIQHQDVAPNNLLVHEATDKIMLFDFNIAVRVNAQLESVGAVKCDEGCDVNGVIFTVYEIVTRDYHLRGIEYSRQDISSILKMDWVEHPDVRLDRPLATYKAILDAWVLRRKQRTKEVITDTSNYINWPDIPKYRRRAISGREARANNLQVIEWKRPAQGKIEEGLCVSADDTVIKTSNKAWKSP